MRKDKRVQGPSVSVAERRIQSPGLIYRMQNLNPFPGRAGDKYSGKHLPPPPIPPLQGSLGKDPLPPSTEQTPSPGKLPSRIDLGENLILASKSGSKVMVRAQDDRLEQI